MTSERQSELLAYGSYFIAVLVLAAIVCLVGKLRLRAVTARPASDRHPPFPPLSPGAILLRSFRWAFVATLLASATCFLPGIAHLCYGAVTLACLVVYLIGVPARFLEPAGCVLLMVTLLLLFTAFRLTQLVDRHGIALASKDEGTRNPS